MKKNIVLILCAVMLFSVFSVPARAEEEQPGQNEPVNVSSAGTLSSTAPASGIWGDNLTWSLDSAGKLTISGSGPMDDINFPSLEAWLEYTDSILSVEIEPGVTSIGGWAFNRCPNLVSVTIPDGVTSIGGGAFVDCSNLASIDIPDGVTSIGNIVFDRCTNLEHVSLPNGLTELNDYVLRSCSSLTDITIPYGVTTIGYMSLAWCENLSSVTIPNSVSSISVGAFDECTSLSDVYFLGTESQWNAITIKSSNESLTNATIHFAGITPVSGTWGDNLTWSLDAFGTLTVSGSGPMDDFSFNTPEAWLVYGNSVIKTVIESGVTSIGISAFENCYNMESVTIPNGVTRIWHDSFRDCRSLKSVTIPDGVTQIGGDAFMGCSSLTSVTIPASVLNVGGFLFAGCSSLDSIHVDPENICLCDVDGVLFTKDMTSLLQYPAARSGLYAVPDGVTTLGAGAFQGCGLTSVTFPVTVKSIGMSVFTDGGSLTDVWYYGGTQAEWDQVSIGSYNTALTAASLHCVKPDFVLPAELTVIGEDAFTSNAFCFAALPETATTISSLAFSSCPNLAYISIPEGTSSIAADAFRNVTGLTVFGCFGSTAELFAQEQGFTFVPCP